MTATRSTTHPRPRTWFAAAAIIAALLAASAVTQLRWGLFVPHEREISGSWAFELDDPTKVLGYADFVVVASVVGRGETVKSMRTNYEIDVERSVKGQLDGRWDVSQLGYQQGRDTFVPEDQSPLRVGESYLLALVVDVDSETLNVLGGPVAVQAVSDDSADASALADPGLRGEYPAEMAESQAASQKRRAAFVASHPGTG